MRPLPHNREAEAAVIAGILLRNEALGDISGELCEESFYFPKYRAVWRAMLALAARGEPIDTVTVAHHLQTTNELGFVGGLEGLGKMSDSYASSHHVAHHAELVANVAAQRRLVEICDQLADEGRALQGDIPSWIDEAQRKVMEAGARSKVTYRPISEFLHTEFATTAKQAMAAKEARVKGQPIPLTGLRTGLHRVDEMLCGMQPGDLIVLAARPSMGKTALAMQIAENVAGDGEPVLVISLEMSGGALTRRLMFSVGRLNGKKFREGRLLEEDMRDLVHSADRINKLPISIDDRSGLAIREMRAAARRWRKDRAVFPKDGRRRTGMVLVDYIQLGEGEDGAERRDLEIAQITKGLKGIAKELELPVLALSQLNRGVDSRADHRPQLGDLRESGAIEQDADVVAFIYREARYLADDHPEKLAKERDAEIIIGKQRNGEIGTAHVVWMGEHTRFENPTHHHPSDERR